MRESSQGSCKNAQRFFGVRRVETALGLYISFQSIIQAWGCDCKSGSFAFALKRGVADWVHGADKGLTRAAESDKTLAWGILVGRITVCGLCVTGV